MSLGEFHAITSNDSDSNKVSSLSQQTATNAPQQLVRIDWAEEMEKLDDNTSEFN